MTSGDYLLLSCGRQSPIVHCGLLGNNGVFRKWQYMPALIVRLDSLQNDLKGAFNAQAREITQKKKLEQIRIKTPQNRQQIVSLNWFYRVVCCVGCWTNSVVLFVVLGVELILSCCLLCWLLNWFCRVVWCVSGVDLGWWVALLFSGGENAVWVWRAWPHAALTRGRFGQMVRYVAGEQADPGSNPLWLAFLFQNWFMDAVCWLITHTVNEMFKVVHKCHCLS